MQALIDGVKNCSKCSTVKPFQDFHKDSTSKTGLAYWCKVCANASTRRHNRANKGNPRYDRVKRNGWIKNTHGISLEEYEGKLAAQNYECAICLVKLQASGHATHLDHSHKTGKHRAFLCTNCNRGLGHFQDSPDLLRVAAAYLDTHSQDVDLAKEVVINASSH